MKQTVIVTGAGGQLGRELARRAPRGTECRALARGELDIADPAAVQAVLARHRPRALINAAAYTAVDRAESEPELAQRVNAGGPATLARACAHSDCRLLHVSTDFVFDGESAHPYGATAATAPLGVYGKSKLAGEQALQQTLPEAVIFRTGWVYSAFGANFVKTMLRLMAERDTLNVVVDQVGTPTWAADLASALWRALERPELQGIYHWSDAGVCSWYDFAVAIYEEALALELLQREVQIRPITAAQYPTPARRPAYSVLDKADTWRALEIEGVHWRRQLRAMLQDLKEQNHE